jgi:myo-inositol-1(or 4)-monophosphatase
METQISKITTVINYNRVAEIIQEAGIVLLDRFNKRNSRHLEGVDTGYVKEKTEKELVIREDLISQDIVINGIKEFDPDAIIYSEELDNMHLLEQDENEIKFILDPLDGTHNFYFGMPYWGIGLAVLDKQNESIAGFIYLPALNIFIKNEGNNSSTLLKNGNDWIKCSTTARPLKKSIICYDNQFYKLGNTAIKIYDILAHDVFTSRITGSAITDAALIATGRINGRIWNKTEPYDIAPGIPIVRGAGGMVSDFNNNDINVLQKSVIISSDKLLHERLIQEINLIK